MRGILFLNFASCEPLKEFNVCMRGEFINYVSSSTLYRKPPECTNGSKNCHQNTYATDKNNYDDVKNTCVDAHCICNYVSTFFVVVKLMLLFQLHASL